MTVIPVNINGCNSLFCVNCAYSSRPEYVGTKFTSRDDCKRRQEFLRDALDAKIKAREAADDVHEIVIEFKGRFSVAQHGCTEEAAIADAKQLWAVAAETFNAMDYITIDEVGDPQVIGDDEHEQ